MDTRVFVRRHSRRIICALMSGGIFCLSPALHATQADPKNLLPVDMTALPAPDVASADAVATPVDGPKWTRELAQQLLLAINESYAAGLDPADYQAAALAMAIDHHKKKDIDTIARVAFAALAHDLRDGKAPSSARLSWYVTDPDATTAPTATLMSRVLANGDVAGTLAGLEPVHPDYRALKAALAATPADQAETIARLRANLDRWRWLPRSLGTRYLLVNVPAFGLKLVDGGTVKSEHRIIVGKTGTPTPQLNATVQGVIFNPSWYVPQSIMKEGLGSLIRSNPSAARAKGYDWSVSNGTIYARQLPGPTNALGYVKLDMPNPYSIYIHDTPGKQLFDREVRSFSHGCMRTDRAMFLAGMLSGLYAGKTPQEIGDIVRSGKTTKVALQTPFPVYVSYFTAAPDKDGTIVYYNDLYGRDVPLMQMFAKNPASVIAPPSTNSQAEPTQNDENDLLN